MEALTSLTSFIPKELQTLVASLDKTSKDSRRGFLVSNDSPLKETKIEGI